MIKSKYPSLLLIILATITAPFLFTLLSLNSYTPGLMLSCIIIIMYSMIFSPPKIEKYQFKIFLFATAGILICGLISLPHVFISTMDLPRTLASISGFLLLLLTSLFLAACIKQTNDKKIDTNAKFIFRLMVLIWMIQLSGSNLPWTADREKPILFFAEVSHYVLAISPFYLYYFSIVGFKTKTLIFSSTIIIITITPSLTMAALLAIAALLIRNRVSILALLLPVVTAVIYFSSGENINYYTERINLAGENLSTLVFLSGWQRAYLSLVDYAGIGVGFQQMGINGRNGDLYDVIVSLTNGGVNLYDGGSNAAKIVTELGVVGLGVIIFYLYIFFKSVLYLRAQPIDALTANNFIHNALAASFINSYSIDLFVRGQGYFTPGTLLFFTGLFLFNPYDTQRRENNLRREKPDNCDTI